MTLKGTLITATAILAAGAGMAALRAQEAAPPASSRIGLVDLYDIEEQAPQFVDARRAIGELEARNAAVLRAGSAYTMLTPEQFDRAVELEMTPPVERTADQAGELSALQEIDAEAWERFSALMQASEGERTPESVAEYDRLKAQWDACSDHQAALRARLSTEIDQQLRTHEETATRALDAVLTEIAAEKGLELIVQPRIRTIGRNAYTGDPLPEFHRVVHYGGTDVTAEAITKLTARYSEAGALAMGE